MADLKISQLPSLAGSALQADDAFAVVDVSASETKKITAKDVIQNGVALIDDGSIPGAKVNVTLAAGSVGTTELADDSVTAAKLANSSSAVLASPLPASGSYTGQIAVDTSNNSAHIWNGTAWVAFRTGILDIQGGTVGSVTTAVTITDGSASVLAQIDDSTVGAAFLAGPTAEGGDVELRTIVPGDLPIATATTAGIVTIPTDGGLTIDGDDDSSNLVIDNEITASAVNHLVTYNARGLVTGGRVIASADLPIATANAVGAISAGAAFAVTDAGELSIANNVTAATHPVITYNADGLVTAGRALTGTDLPQIPLDRLPDIPIADVDFSDGDLPTADNIPDVGIGVQQQVTAIPDGGISRRHLSNTSTAYIQETQPTSNATAGTDQTVFRGCLWFRESTGQLYMYNGNAWHIIAGGRLAQENLRFCGTINADTGNVTSLTDEGASEQLANGNTAFAVGSPLPAADDDISACYFLVDTAGNGINVNQVSGDDFEVGDLCLAISTATGWVQVGGLGGGAGGGGGFWERAGASPTATLTPTNNADNITLGNSQWLQLPRHSGTGAPGGGEGSLRWDDINNIHQVYSGTAWENIVVDPATAGTYARVVATDGAEGTWTELAPLLGATVGDDPPADPEQGALWWDSDSGRLFVWYEDANSSQWVAATPETGSGGSANGGGGGATTLNQLTDVNATATANAVLYYNDSNNRWESTTTISSADFTIDGGTF